MNIRFSALLEEVYGVNVVAYHRTKSEDIISGIIDKGFIPGYGMMYGQGFYATYDLDSQLKPDMKESYGDIILKVFIKAYKFLIFDYEIAKKLYKNKYTIIDQLKQMNLLKYVRDIKTIERYSTTLETIEYSSDIALKVYENEKSIISSINGIIFIGRKDGKVIVAYEPNAIIPMAFSEDNGKSWIKINNKQALQRYFINKQDVMTKQNIKIKLTYEELTNLVNSNKISLDNAMKLLIDLENINNIIQAERDWKKFDYDKGLDAIIDLQYKHKNLIYYLGHNWKKFDYKKGLNVLIELKDYISIYLAGRDWKEFDYKKGLDALIELGDTNGIVDAGRDWKEFDYKKGLDGLIKNNFNISKNIYDAGQYWKKFDYKKGLDALKQSDNEDYFYYKMALQDWKGKY
jgi:hypothetical protein